MILTTASCCRAACPELPFVLMPAWPSLAVPIDSTITGLATVTTQGTVVVVGGRVVVVVVVVVVLDVDGVDELEDGIVVVVVVVLVVVVVGVVVVLVMGVVLIVEMPGRKAAGFLGAASIRSNFPLADRTCNST